MEADPIAPTRSEADGPGASDAQAAPRETDVEAEVLSIWRTVLRYPEITLDDDFFEIGGHSVFVVQIAARAEAAFGMELPMQDFYDFSTARGMAACIKQLLAERQAHPAAAA